MLFKKFMDGLKFRKSITYYREVRGSNCYEYQIGLDKT